MSAEEHRLRGTFRADRHGERPSATPSLTDTVTSPSAAIVEPPATLSKAERAYWDRFAPLLAGAKVLTPADAETLGDYCRACVAVDDRGGRLQTALRQRVLNTSLVRMLDSSLRGWVGRKTKLANELGLTASARAAELDRASAGRDRCRETKIQVGRIAGARRRAARGPPALVNRSRVSARSGRTNGRPFA
jgi:phage terminase small subunit